MNVELNDSNLSLLAQVPDSPQKLELQDFRIIRFLGEGSFGKVYLVQRAGTSDKFAMKVIRKDRLLDTRILEKHLREKHVLETANH